jgi:hypothetical protein
LTHGLLDDVQARILVVTRHHEAHARTVITPIFEPLKAPKEEG